MPACRGDLHVGFGLEDERGDVRQGVGDEEGAGAFGGGLDLDPGGDLLDLLTGLAGQDIALAALSGRTGRDTEQATGWGGGSGRR